LPGGVSAALTWRACLSGVEDRRLAADDKNMPLLPAERFVIDAPAAPDEVRERLSSAVVRSRKASVRTPEAPFTGTMDANSFELRPVLGYRNSFVPTARGSFASGVAGTRIDVRLRMLPGVVLFMALWLSLSAAFFIGMLVIAFRNPSRWWLPLVGIAFFAFGYGLMALSFSFEARRIRTNLTLLVSGIPASELPRTDLSWLSDFRLRNAETPERRFNRIFLTTYSISGALTVLTWDRTVTACSNPQYQHRDQYSCPGDARIALTWILGGVLVATGLLSRVALHKRVRRAYIPLALIVLVVGAVAGWLITHHAHWGVPS
jgi:FtsH-binding integral membrane protein